jgi:hypothetical protein
MPTKVNFLPAFTWAILAIITFSQCGEICDFSPPRLEQTNWKLVELNNSGVEPTIEYDNICPKESFGLRLQYTMTTYSEPSCPDNYFEIVNPVTEFNIYTAQDFDQTHPAGSILNDYFLVRSLNTHTKLSEYKSISASMDLFNKYNGPNVEIDYLLVQPPEQPGDYQFKVKLKFSNPDSAILSSRLITLK